MGCKIRDLAFLGVVGRDKGFWRWDGWGDRDF